MFPTKMATCTRTSTLALLFLVIGSYQWQVTTLPVLTPSTMLSACPGDEVVIKCVESETTTRISLRWIITPINVMIHKIDLSLSNLMNNTNRLDARLQFYAELTSYYPLSSILTATAHPALDGATVTCITLTSRDSLIIRVIQLDQPEIQWLNVSGGWFGEDNLTVIIEWEGNSDCLDFTVSFTSQIDSSSNYNITTKNRSHTFSIFYNTNYTVTVASSSGNSNSEISKTFNFIKCDPPSLPGENVVVNGYIPPALENTRIFLTCLPGYGFPHTREVISMCTSEAVWSLDFSQLDLECQSELTTTRGDCVELSLLSGVYRILNQTSSYLEGSLVEFQCVHTHYQIDPLFTTQCQAGQWNPHPGDVCGQDLTGEMWIMPVIATLGVVVALLSLILFGTFSALLIIVHKYYKKGRTNGINRPGSQLHGEECIPGSGVLTPNVSYELTKISQKQQVSHGHVDLERNPAYATVMSSPHANTQLEM